MKKFLGWCGIIFFSAIVFVGFKLLLDETWMEFLKIVGETFITMIALLVALFGFMFCLAIITEK